MILNKIETNLKEFLEQKEKSILFIYSKRAVEEIADLILKAKKFNGN